MNKHEKFWIQKAVEDIAYFSRRLENIANGSIVICEDCGNIVQDPDGGEFMHEKNCKVFDDE